MSKHIWNWRKTLETRTKYCYSCKEIRSIELFSPLKTRKDGYCSRCQVCDKKRRANPDYILKIYKYSANIRGYEFDIKDSDFINLLSKPCYYCGVKLEKMGVDRMDNGIGYKKSNCVACCWTCNSLKNRIENADSDFRGLLKIANTLVSLE